MKPLPPSQVQVVQHHQKHLYDLRELVHHKVHPDADAPTTHAFSTPK